MQKIGWINNNAYNVVKVTSADETQYVTFIVATGNKVDTSTEESTELQKPAQNYRSQQHLQV